MVRKGNRGIDRGIGVVHDHQGLLPGKPGAFRHRITGQPGLFLFRAGQIQQHLQQHSGRPGAVREAAHINGPALSIVMQGQRRCPFLRAEHPGIRIGQADTGAPAQRFIRNQERRFLKTGFG